MAGGLFEYGSFVPLFSFVFHKKMLTDNGGTGGVAVQCCTIFPNRKTKREGEANYEEEGMERVHIRTYTMAELTAAVGEERTACQSHTSN